MFARLTSLGTQFGALTLNLIPDTSCNFEFQWNFQLIPTPQKGSLGVFWELSFIALIVWCRWRGTPEDQREVTPPELPKRKERQNETVEINPSAPSITQ